MRIGIVLIVLACLMLSGCGGENPLVGTWRETNGSVTFEFKSTGKVNIAVATGESDTGTYKVENGKLAVASEIWSGDSDWMPFTIVGDTLTLGEGQGTLTFGRVQQ